MKSAKATANLPCSLLHSTLIITVSLPNGWKQTTDSAVYTVGGKNLTDLSKCTEKFKTGNQKEKKRRKKKRFY